MFRMQTNKSLPTTTLPPSPLWNSAGSLVSVLKLAVTKATIKSSSLERLSADLITLLRRTLICTPPRTRNSHSPHLPHLAPNSPLHVNNFHPTWPSVTMICSNPLWFLHWIGGKRKSEHMSFEGCRGWQNVGECGLSAWQRASITLAGKRTLLTTDGRQAFTTKLVECDKWPRVLNMAVETVSHLMNEKHVEVQQWDGWLDKPFQHSLCFAVFSLVPQWFYDLWAWLHGTLVGVVIVWVSLLFHIEKKQETLLLQICSTSLSGTIPT